VCTIALHVFIPKTRNPEGKPPLPSSYAIRPDSGIGGRGPSARPMSARKAPPRPRTALLREMEEQPNYRSVNSAAR